MGDLKSLTVDEMIKDYRESMDDANLCDFAIRLGVDYHGLKSRASTNRKIMAVIEGELAHRGELDRLVEGIWGKQCQIE